MLKRRARAATVFSPPDKLSIGRNLSDYTVLSVIALKANYEPL